MIVNLVLNLVLMGPLKHAGLSLATALSAWLNIALLAYFLRTRGHLRFDARLKRRLPRMVLAAALMGLALWLAAWVLAAPLAGGLGLKAAALSLLVMGGLALYALLAQGLGAARLGELKAMLARPGA